MAGTALALPFPTWTDGDARDELRRLLRDAARAGGRHRPRSVAEHSCLAELESSPARLDLATWEGVADDAHRCYRRRGCPYRDVQPEQLARAVGLRVVHRHQLWRPHLDPATGVLALAPKSDPHAAAFDAFHEIAEALCLDLGASHADVQWVTVALMVERGVAARALGVVGHGRAVAALARTHRRVRRCFLAVRLLMVGAAG